MTRPPAGQPVEFFLNRPGQMPDRRRDQNVDALLHKNILVYGAPHQSKLAPLTDMVDRSGPTANVRASAAGARVRIYEAASQPISIHRTFAACACPQNVRHRDLMRSLR